MKRRDFLSLVSCAALSAIVPRPKYFFLNGVWQRPDPGAITLGMLESAFQKAWEQGYVQVENIWVKENGRTQMYQRIGDGPFVQCPGLHFHGEAPFVRLRLSDPPWEP